MTLPFELLLPRRPVSHQAKSSSSKQAWRDYIYSRAFSVWKQTPIVQAGLKFTVVYLCEGNPCDINNVIKPIQYALNGLIYADDSLVWDVSGHMRLLTDIIDDDDLPALLVQSVIQGNECVYVRISQSLALNVEIGT